MLNHIVYLEHLFYSNEHHDFKPTLHLIGGVVSHFVSHLY